MLTPSQILLLFFALTLSKSTMQSTSSSSSKHADSQRSRLPDDPFDFSKMYNDESAERRADSRHRRHICDVNASTVDSKAFHECRHQLQRGGDGSVAHVVRFLQDQWKSPMSSGTTLDENVIVKSLATLQHIKNNGRLNRIGAERIESTEKRLRNMLSAVHKAQNQSSHMSSKSKPR